MIQDEANTTVRYLSNTNRRRRRRRGKNSDYTIIGWRKAQSLGNRLKRRQKPNNPPRIHLRRKQTRGGGGWKGRDTVLAFPVNPLSSPLFQTFPLLKLIFAFWCTPTPILRLESSSPQNPPEFRNFGHAENKLGGMGFRGQSFPEHASLEWLAFRKTSAALPRGVSPARFLRFCHIRRGDLEFLSRVCWLKLVEMNWVLFRCCF